MDAGQNGQLTCPPTWAHCKAYRLSRNCQTLNAAQWVQESRTGMSEDCFARRHHAMNILSLPEKLLLCICYRLTEREFCYMELANKRLRRSLSRPLGPYGRRPRNPEDRRLLTIIVLECGNTAAVSVVVYIPCRLTDDALQVASKEDQSVQSTNWQLFSSGSCGKETQSQQSDNKPRRTSCAAISARSLYPCS